MTLGTAQSDGILSLSDANRRALTDQSGTNPLTTSLQVCASVTTPVAGSWVILAQCDFRQDNDGTTNTLCVGLVEVNGLAVTSLVQQYEDGSVDNQQNFRNLITRVYPTGFIASGSVLRIRANRSGGAGSVIATRISALQSG